MFFVSMLEEEAQTGDHFAFFVESGDGVIHAERVGAGQGVHRHGVLQLFGAGDGEGSHVDVGGYADLSGIGHRVRAAALFVVEGLDGAQCVERG